MDDDLIIHSVMFRPDGLVEISFAQKSEDTGHAALIRTIVFDERAFEDEMTALRVDLSEIIEEVLVFLRNPDVRAARVRAVPEPEVPTGFSAAEF